MRRGVPLQVGEDDDRATLAEAALSGPTAVRELLTRLEEGVGG